MSQPLGYWSLELDNPLIADIAETWGQCLENLSEADRLWLIARVANEAWNEEPTNSAQSEEAEEVFHRLHEIRFTQKCALIQALANK